MRLKNIYLSLLAVFISLHVSAQKERDISELFDSLKVNPVHKTYTLSANKALQNKRIAAGNLYPEIFAYGKYDYSDSPVGMMPISPNELIQMVQDASISQPYSENILRGGVNVSIPIFVKSIYTTIAKAEKMYEAATIGADIELQKNEAIIVGANANLMYMENLEAAIQSKRKSLEKMKELITIKVNNGRAPESALLLINTNVNELDLNLAKLQINKAKAKATIYTLTNIYLDSAVNLTQNAEFRNGDFVVLKPLEKKIEAARLDVRAEKEKLYPALFGEANYVYNHAKAYNNNEVVNNDFTTAAITLKIPLFSKAQYSKIKLSNVELQEQQNEFEKTRMEISAQTNQLITSLELLNVSIGLNKNSIESKWQLLDIAKKSYLKDRMTVEDYLKYEDDLLFEKANLYQTQAEKWQTLMNLAVIYGNNIENLVK